MHVQRRPSDPKKNSKNTNKLVLLVNYSFEPNPICFKKTFAPRAKRNKQLNALSYLTSFSLHSPGILPFILFSGTFAEGLTYKIKLSYCDIKPFVL